MIEINGELNQNNKDELSKSNVDTIFPRIVNISYDEFFCDYMNRNVPCVMDSCYTASWPSRRDWVKKENGELIPDLARFIMRRVILNLLGKCSICEMVNGTQMVAPHRANSIRTVLKEDYEVPVSNCQTRE